MDTLADGLAAETGESKKVVKKILSALPDVIREVLKTSDGVKLYRVATIRHGVAAARQMTNIRTKEKFDVPQRPVLKAKVSKYLK